MGLQRILRTSQPCLALAKTREVELTGKINLSAKIIRLIIFPKECLASVNSKTATKCTKKKKTLRNTQSQRKTSKREAFSYKLKT
jgi:hypothetical protein